MVIGVYPRIKFWRFLITYGHNCDQRTFTSFGTRELLERDKINIAGEIAISQTVLLTVLGDGGYTHHRVLLPEAFPGVFDLMNQTRSATEHMFAQVQSGKTAGGKKDACFRRNVDLQVDCLIFQYHRTQDWLNKEPRTIEFE